jgi:hypothetical protein
MRSAKPITSQFTTRALQHCALLSGLYVILIFLLPPNPQTSHLYHLAAFQYHVILFAVALPSLAVWLAAFISYAKLHQYAQLVSKTPESDQFNQLARGCTWLAWSLPVSTILPMPFNTLADHWPHLHPLAIILANYTALVLPLVAFSIIANSSRGLVTSAKIKSGLAATRLILLGFVTTAVLYCLLTFRRFDLTNLGSTANPYFLPLWLMVTTITVPYLYVWFVGLLAAYEITLFSKQVQGVLYRQALRLVVGGLLAVILSSIALQYISSVEPRVGHLVLDYKLVLALLCRVIGGGGFILLALGATRLKKIEEV